MVGSPLEFSSMSQWAGFAAGTVLAVIALGEGQAYFVSMFQVYSQRERMVHDLNPFHHLDATSLPLLVVAGWAWGRKRPSLPSYFPESRLCRAMVPLSGVAAVLLLSGILGTFYLVVPGPLVETAIQATSVILAANFVVPIPPLSLGRAIFQLFEGGRKLESFLEYAGAGVLTALALVERYAEVPLLQWLVLPVGRALSRWIVSA